MRFVFLLLLAVRLVSPAEAGQAVRHFDFATPEAAVEALGVAYEKADRKAMAAILGDKGMRIVNSGDAVIDAAERASFMRLFRKDHTIEPESDRRSVLVLGEEEMPFPVPLVSRGGRWRFDANDGHEDLLSRRIGATERIAMDLLQVLAKAQHRYFREVPQADGIPRFAARFLGDATRRDGLAWPDGAGSYGGPMGAFASVAAEEGYRLGTPLYRGYRYQPLPAQGASAPGGVRRFTVDGRMTGGFGILACPIRYGVSGVLSFMVGQEGIVYHKDLGPKTNERCRSIKAFDPDRSWTRGAGS